MQWVNKVDLHTNRYFSRWPKFSSDVEIDRVNNYICTTEELTRQETSTTQIILGVSSQTTTPRIWDDRNTATMDFIHSTNATPQTPIPPSSRSWPPEKTLAVVSLPRCTPQFSKGCLKFISRSKIPRTENGAFNPATDVLPLLTFTIHCRTDDLRKLRDFSPGQCALNTPPNSRAKCKA